jgi:hypothetical protein
MEDGDPGRVLIDDLPRRVEDLLRGDCALVVLVSSVSHDWTCPPPRIWRLPSPTLMWVVEKRSHSCCCVFWIWR